MTDKSKEKEERYEKHKDERRKPIKKADVKKLATPVKEGKFWVIRKGGVELRNTKKGEVSNDFATINNYKII